MTLALINEPIFVTNAIYDLLINSFQGIVYNSHIGISPNIKNITEIDVSRKLRFNIKGVWTLEKYLIGQFEGHQYIENIE